MFNLVNLVNEQHAIKKRMKWAASGDQDKQPQCGRPAHKNSTSFRVSLSYCNDHNRKTINKRRVAKESGVPFIGLVPNFVTIVAGIPSLRLVTFKGEMKTITTVITSLQLS